MKNKGLGPMIAAMILITIAVSMASLVYIWSADVTKQSSLSLQEITKKKISCQGSNFYIDGFSFVCKDNNTGCALNADKNFTFKVRNSGDNDVFLKNVYIRNSNSTLYEFKLNSTLVIGDDTDFIIPTKLPCAGLSNEISEVIVTSDCPDLYDSMKDGIEYLKC